MKELDEKVPKSHVDEWNPICLSPLRQDSVECPQCGGHFAQKSELRVHQMARKSVVRGSLRTKIRAELLSKGSECGVRVSPRTKIRAELLSNGEQLALPP